MKYCCVPGTAVNRKTILTVSSVLQPAPSLDTFLSHQWIAARRCQ